MSTANTAFQELDAILAEENEAHQRLLDAAAHVNSAIRESDVETLRKRSTVLDQRIVEVQRIEERRTECCKALSFSLGLGSGAVRLARLIEKAPPALREKCVRSRASLQSVLEKIARITVANRILLEEGLRIAHGRLRTIMRPDGRFAQYAGHGRRAAPDSAFHPFINQTA